MNNKALFRELPYYSYDIISSHGQFSNGLNTNLPTKKYLDCLPSFKDLDFFTLNGFLLDKNSDFNTLSPAISCKYYSPHSFFHPKEHMQPSSFPKFSLFYTNIRSLRRNLKNFQTHLLEELDFRFNIIGITETRIKKYSFAIS